MIHPLEEIETKPFCPNASRQIILVSDFSWIPFDALRNLEADIMELFVPTEFMDEERIETLECRNRQSGRITGYGSSAEKTVCVRKCLMKNIKIK